MLSKKYETDVEKSPDESLEKNDLTDAVQPEVEISDDLPEETRKAPAKKTATKKTTVKKTTSKKAAAKKTQKKTSTKTVAQPTASDEISSADSKGSFIARKRKNSVVNPHTRQGNRRRG